MPRPRFTIRRMMVAVAMAGCVLGSFEAERRWERANRPMKALTVTSVRITRFPAVNRSLPVEPDTPEPK